MILTGFLTGLIVLFIVFSGVIGVFFYAKRRVTRDMVRLLQSPSSDIPSPFALIVQSIANVFGQEIANHLKAVFLGLQSVEAKNERKEATQALIQDNALLSTIISSFPAVGKKMTKNPALAQLAGIVINKELNKNNPSERSQDSNPVKFEF